MNNKKRLIAIILSLLMVFSNIINIFGFEFDVPIINGGDIIYDTDFSSGIDSQVIINGDNSINSNIDTGNNIKNNINNTYNKTNNIIKEQENKISIEKENALTENGRIIKAKIVPTGFNENSRALKQFTLVGRDKGVDATVSFKGDEIGATTHQIIDYITRHNGDNNSIGYCISPFYAGAKENGTTTVVETTATENDNILMGIAIAGYPTNKYNIASLNTLTEEEQYYATKIAMEHFIFQKTEYKNKKGVKFNDDEWKATRWFPNPKVSKKQQEKAKQIINVAKEIYTKGKANPYNTNNGIATIKISDNYKNNGTMKAVGNEYILTLDISSDINYSDVVLTFKDPKIKEWATGGNTKIQFYDGDKNGTRLHYKTHNIAGESIEGIRISKASRKSDKITIVLDKETAENVIAGNTGSYNVDYDAKFFGGNVKVGFRTKNIDNNLQDYAIIITGNVNVKSNINWLKNSTPPDKPQTKGKGGLKILKYNKKTNELVAGAIFKVRGIS